MTADRHADGDDARQTAVLEAISGRRSVRGFLAEPVPRETLEKILTVAARAPSATNTQPWRVRVLTGATRARLSAAILAEREGGAIEPPPEYDYYPKSWPEPYLARRRALGWTLYALLGIKKGDQDAARRWQDNNFRFFGAPVGLIFTLDRKLATGSFMDVAMFVENIAVAARAFGLDTCPQAAFAHYHATIRRELALDEEELVVCGMALGRADEAAPANRLESAREPLENFAVFLD
ncbi:nitroreductase family protein [Methylocella sp.]|uniref:nitroreductase family protein n=1 Tax=Methylocella sp. TaxID=1978226 RepID=UPI0037841646